MNTTGKELLKPLREGGDVCDAESLSIISRSLGLPLSDIDVIRPLKEGMTNLSFLFQVKGGESYVFRRPGVGTDKLINRRDEKRSYELVRLLDISDEVLYFDENTGEKISKFYRDSRISDPTDEIDVRSDMSVLRGIHEAEVVSVHRFDIEERIDYYENLAVELNAITFHDYKDVRAEANQLLLLRRALGIPEILCHIDFVYANLLHLSNGKTRVIDWEYSGAADPLIDVAMYSIYALYEKPQIDSALYHYLRRTPSHLEETRLYMYVALGGFLWSLWTEYKQGLGDKFGEYSGQMYNYMKSYYKVLRDGGYLDGYAIGTC